MFHIPRLGPQSIGCRLSFLCLLFAFYHTAGWCDYPTPSPSKQSILKIGVIAPLSGTAAHVGTEMTRVTSIIEDNFCNHNCKFLIEDGKAAIDSSPTSAVNKLHTIDGVSLFLVASSGEVLQSAPIAEREHLLLMATYAGHPDIRKYKNIVFRTFPDFGEAAKDLAAIFTREDALPISLLTEDHVFTVSMSKLLTQKLAASIADEVTYHYDERGFRTLFLRLAQRHPRAYYFSCANPSTCASIVIQAKQLNLPQRIYSFLHLDNEEFLKVAGREAEGVRFLGTPLGNDTSPRFKEFSDVYRKRYPEGPRNEYLMRSTFDATMALLDCSPSGTAQQEMASCLHRYRQKGALGDISFTENGEIDGLHFILKEIKNGLAIPVNP